MGTCPSRARRHRVDDTISALHVSEHFKQEDTKFRLIFTNTARLISPSFFSLSHTIYPVIQTTYYFTLFFSLPFIRFFQFYHQTKTRLIWFSVISLSVFGQGIIDFDDEQPSQAGIALVQLQTKHKSPDAHINNNNNILYVYQ